RHDRARLPHRPGRRRPARVRPRLPVPAHARAGRQRHAGPRRARGAEGRRRADDDPPAGAPRPGRCLRPRRPPRLADESGPRPPAAEPAADGRLTRTLTQGLQLAPQVPNPRRVSCGRTVDTGVRDMRKLVLSTVALAALAGSGLAIAHGFDTRSIKAVGSTFTTTPVGTVQTSTCTGADGSYTRSHGTYTGTVSNATGDANLNGPITIDAKSLINTSTNVGVVTAHIRFGSDASGNVAGLVEGHAPGSTAALLGNLSAAFSTTNGFTNGNIGGANSGGAVEL